MKTGSFFKKIKNTASFAAMTGIIASAFWSTRVQAQAGDVTALAKLDDVLAAMNQSSAKITNFRARSIAVRTTSPLFWGEFPEPSKSAQFIKGYQVEVHKELGLYGGVGKASIDQLIVRVTPQRNLLEHNRFWLDKSRKVGYHLINKSEFIDKFGSVAQVNGGTPTAYEDPEQIVPFSALGRMQVGGRSSIYEYLRTLEARVTGQQEFRGLQCIRLEWDRPAKQKNLYSRKGFVLVCPSRDYKEVYKEEQANSNNPEEPVKQFTEKMVVEQFKRFSDAWLPAVVRYERQDFYAKGETRSLRELFRVVEFEAGAVKDDSVFTPLFSPGTRVFRAGFEGAGGKLEIIGGDTRAIEDSLRGGDLSLLEEEKQQQQDNPKP